MSRPSFKEFMEWTKNDRNVPQMQNALSIFPDFANIKDNVSVNPYVFNVFNILTNIYYLLIYLLNNVID